jgi:hypothetical protein
MTGEAETIEDENQEHQNNLKTFKLAGSAMTLLFLLVSCR